VTVVMFTSIKGAPGVTTLTCLVGATWPSHRQVAVIESDPFGGDLAARFGLSAKRGWSTFSAASGESDPTSRSLPTSSNFPAGSTYWSKPARSRLRWASRPWPI
jgi:cellulose biosynthesis protein BcsQ